MPELKLNPKYRPRVAAVTGWTILFFVLLRVAIGWHFLYEGISKIKSGTFSATPYLLASVGPFKDLFRSMVDDADGFKRMGVVRDEEGNIIEIRPDYQKAQIDERVKLITEHYGLNDEQKKVLKSIADQKKRELDEMYGLVVTTQPVFDGPARNPTGIVVEKRNTELFDQIVAYDNLLKQVREEEKLHDPSYLQERMEFNLTKINSARNAILARIEEPIKGGPDVFKPRVAPMNAIQVDVLSKLPQADREYLLKKYWNPPGVELTEEQLAKGPLPMPQATHFPGNLLSRLGMEFKTTTRTEWQDLGMMFGLVAIGACLVLGLFTRFAAFCAAVFLAMFYFSMPPWPGVPAVPPQEGNYLIVNKNLIELIACLMIMTSRVGRWVGLDAFLGAIRDRRRRHKAEREAIQLAQSPRDDIFIPGVTRPADRGEPARA